MRPSRAGQIPVVPSKAPLKFLLRTVRQASDTPDFGNLTARARRKSESVAVSGSGCLVSIKELNLSGGGGNARSLCDERAARPPLEALGRSHLPALVRDCRQKERGSKI